VSQASSLAIRASKLTKEYRLYPTQGARVLEWLTGRPRHRVHRALSAIDFEQYRGEGLAVVGENGAGKSTLLKIISGVTRATSGRAEAFGRIAAILELGAGFHPDFTGRQNIRLNAALLGLTEAEVVRREPEIVDWSELGEYIDRPVREYSSGMTVRLGFSIATQVDPEILIVDEALSVGDGYFQKKSMDRMVQFVEAGGTLMFCSHSLYLVSAFCQKALWLRNGQAEAYGATSEVIREYESYLVSRQQSLGGRDPDDSQISGELRPARFVAIRALDVSGDLPTWRLGDSVRYEIAFESDDADRVFHLGALLETEDHVTIASLGSNTTDEPRTFSGRRSHRVVLEIPDLPLRRGRYSITFLLLDERGLHVYDRRFLKDALVVQSPHFTSGLLQIRHRWLES
jgi:lipopolysaccharide transport system ATP-binding protein